MAATVSSPSGGNAACLATNRTACFRLQNVSGVWGETSRMFMTVSSAAIPVLHIPSRTLRSTRADEGCELPAVYAFQTGTPGELANRRGEWERERWGEIPK